MKCYCEDFGSSCLLVILFTSCVQNLNRFFSKPKFFVNKTESDMNANKVFLSRRDGGESYSGTVGE